MPPVLIPDVAAARLDPIGPVKVPLGGPVAELSGIEPVAAEGGLPAAGVWECTPGRWRRQVLSAEFCQFVAGHCVFEPDDGPPIEIRAGDAVYFPANSTGVWDVKVTVRKSYVVF
jgi:uncharacterized cupin superfamily protein